MEGEQCLNGDGALKMNSFMFDNRFCLTILTYLLPLST